MTSTYEVFLLFDEPATGAIEIPRARLAAALSQTRDWPAAEKATARVRFGVPVGDDLPSTERLPDFFARVLAQAEAARPKAILWAPAERLLSTEMLKQAIADEDYLRVAVNVRLFHVEDGGAGESVMDTIGLEPLGFPDAQCHFFGLDRNQLAGLLLDVARYVADEGGEISDGDTFAGLGDATWTCHLEESLVNPPRDVIDLEPPAPSSARRR